MRKNPIQITEGLQVRVENQLKPLLEGVPAGRADAIRRYIHESAKNQLLGSINESFSNPAPAGYLTTPGQINGVGNPMTPGFGNGVIGGTEGTADTFSALSNMPIAVKMLRSTRFLDIVRVRPINEPTGILRFEDLIYTDNGASVYGNAGTVNNPNPYGSYGKRDQGTLFYLNIKSQKAGKAGEDELRDLLRDLRKAVEEERVLYPTNAQLIAAKATAKTIIEVVTGKLYVRILGVGRFNSALLVQEMLDDSVAGQYTKELSLANLFGEFDGFYGADGKIDSTKVHAKKELTIAAKKMDAVGLANVAPIDDPVAGYSSNGRYVPSFRSGSVSVEGLDRGDAEMNTPRRLQSRYTSVAFSVKQIEQTVTVSLEEEEDMKHVIGGDIRKHKEERALALMALEIDTEGLERISQLGWRHAVEAFNSEDINLNVSFRAGATNTPAYYIANLTPGKWGSPETAVALPFVQDVLPTKTTPSMMESGVTLAARLKAVLLKVANTVRVRSKVSGEMFALMNHELVSLLQLVSQEPLMPVHNTISQGLPTADYVGECFGIKVYLDQSLAARDFRVTVGIKSEDDNVPGVIFCPYIMGSVRRNDYNNNGHGLNSLIRSRYAIVNYGFYPQNSYFTFVFDPGTN